MGIHYKNPPFSSDQWKEMMRDTAKKMSAKTKPVSISSILKGFKGMQYVWREMEEELREALLNGVVQMCKEGTRNAREIANSMLYLGDLEVDWKEDVKERGKQILMDLKKNNITEGFTEQALSNTLLGLVASSFLSYSLCF